ncbi:hypothetical protein QM885_09050 [Streptococcus mitis]|jgi:hypothetical protein|uniref:hypothetical protein n=1 Tax=Streptococcus mitis TaxID=28037 RepID=UPI0039C30E63
MRLTKIDKIFSCLLIVEFSTCFIVLENLNIFQFMLFVQIIPSILLALLSGSISSRIKHSWVLLIIFGMIYTLMMFGIFRVTPMTLIEQNTIQSETSVFTFNRNLQLGTYLGFFVQEFLLGAFIYTISKIFGRIKQGKF